MTYELSIRNRDGSPLSNQQIEEVCPAIAATDAHSSRSSKYLPISSLRLIDGLRPRGFVPMHAMQSRSRVEGKQEYTKHLIRLRKVDYIGNYTPDVPEIVIINSHDGTSSYQLMAGIFRVVCTNGLVTGDFTNTIRVMHRGGNDVLEEILAATYTIAEEAEEIMQTVHDWKQIPLNRQEQLFLARHAIEARFGEPDNVVEGSIVPEQPHPLALLRRRRGADEPTDLYTTLNVVQENILQGGVRRQDGKKTRAIRGIDTTVGINRVIWKVAEELAQFKHDGYEIPEETQVLAY